MRILSTGNETDNVTAIVIDCLNNCVDTRLSTLGWSRLASAIASLREFLNTVQHSFISPDNAPQMMNSLEHFQSNSETGISIHRERERIDAPLM